MKKRLEEAKKEEERKEKERKEKLKEEKEKGGEEKKSDLPAVVQLKINYVVNHEACIYTFYRDLCDVFTSYLSS